MKKPHTNLFLLGQIIIFTLPFWFILAITQGIIGDQHPQLQYLAGAVCFSIIFVINENSDKK